MRSKKITYHKLIRDKIPNILHNKGIKFKTHIVKGKEYGWRLKKKLQEEVDEFNQNQLHLFVGY